MRTGFGCGHPLAVEAEEGVLEEKGGYPQLLFFELLEDVLGIVGAVVAAYARMVPAHDEVGAAVVFAAYGVEDSLPRSCVPHRCREDRQDRPVLGVVAVEDDFIALHPHR